jgi:hypothetical protein
MLKISVEKRSGRSQSTFALQLRHHQNNVAPLGSGIGILYTVSSRVAKVKLCYFLSPLFR